MLAQRILVVRYVNNSRIEYSINIQFRDFQFKIFQSQDVFRVLSVMRIDY